MILFKFIVCKLLQFLNKFEKSVAFCPKLVGSVIVDKLLQLENIFVTDVTFDVLKLFILTFVRFEQLAKAYCILVVSDVSMLLILVIEVKFVIFVNQYDISFFLGFTVLSIIIFVIFDLNVFQG